MTVSATTYAGLIPCGQADRAACGVAALTDATDAHMHYYEHHIGDYAAATSHLSFTEDAAYSRLLRIYYRDEKPLPADLKAVQRLAGAREKAERDAVEVVLSEFFALEADGWHNKRADQEIERYTDKRTKAKRSAQSRWNASETHDERNANGMRTHSEGNANASETHDERNATRAPVHNQSPITSNDQPTVDCPQPAAAHSPSCPHIEVIALYHEVLPELRVVREWNDTRKRLLQARWRESRERQSLDWWREFFGYVRQSRFLMGRITGRDGRPFDCDLEWLIRPTNFAKVVEGRYEDPTA